MHCWWKIRIIAYANHQFHTGATARCTAIVLALVIAGTGMALLGRVEASARPAPEPRASAGSVKSTGFSAMQIYAINGTVAANKLPVVSALLYPPAAKANARFDVRVSAIVSDDNQDPPKKGFGKLEVTLYAVDRNGGEKKVATKRAKRKASTGSAAVAFTKMKAPGSHYRAEAKPVGGTVEGGGFTIIGSVGVSGGVRAARRVAAGEAAPGARQSRAVGQ